ncbi:Chromatin structure-remodeling complex subunit snf21 [Fusarium oxysporum f. sp. albedinis]|nr:Chromatin structure-remodeling complex subunit snf21 [Fusarium oxysporum f. sp. albedinis]
MFALIRSRSVSGWKKLPQTEYFWPILLRSKNRQLMSFFRRDAYGVPDTPSGGEMKTDMIPNFTIVTYLPSSNDSSVTTEPGRWTTPTSAAQARFNQTRPPDCLTTSFVNDSHLLTPT